MIAAEKQALVADLHMRRTDIRNLDLSNLTQFLDGVSTQAALLAGFSFTGLTGVPDDTSTFIKVMLYVFTCLTLGSQMYVVCVGQLATVLGPTLALNGPRGSLEKAVTEMRTERGRVFKVFVFGIATFFMEIMAVTAINVEDSWLAAVCIAIIAVALVLIGYYGRRLIRVFHFEETELQQLVRIDRLKDVVMPDDKETKAEDVKITTTSAAEFLGVSDDKAGKFERDKEGDS